MSHGSSPNGTDKVFATVVYGPMWENPYGLHVAQGLEVMIFE